MKSLQHFEPKTRINGSEAKNPEHMETEPIKMEASEIDLQEALKELAGQAGPALAGEIEPVLRFNLRRGRVAYYLHNRPGSAVAGYVWHVAQLYQRLHPYLYELQVEKADPAWVALRAKMERWGYSFLIKKGFSHSEFTRQLARDYSADASAALVNASFPYDTEFEPWAVVLLQNICRKRLREAIHSGDGAAEAAPAGEEWLEHQPDPAAEDSTRQAEMRQDLLRAIQTLDEEAQQILMDSYFQGLKPAEIAARLGKTQAQVYALKFHALQSLRKVYVLSGYES